VHHLGIDYQADGWPSIALLASFDGRAPRPFPVRSMPPGVELQLPLSGREPCPNSP
jgi:hypothetical protein